MDIDKHVIAEQISTVDKEMTEHNARLVEIQTLQVQLQSEGDGLAKTMVSKRGEIIGLQKLLKMVNPCGNDKDTKRQK
jgi:hypothetical protein